MLFRSAVGEGAEFRGIFAGDDLGAGVEAGFEGIAAGGGLALGGAWAGGFLGVLAVGGGLLGGAHPPMDSRRGGWSLKLRAVSG